MNASHKWKEISDLPADLVSFRDTELEYLLAVWKEERQRLGEDSVRDFSTRLAREWAIETGIIEGVYTLDRGITQTLIERGINSSYISHDASNRDPEVVARIVRSHVDVLEGLFAFVKGDRPLTTGYIKALHAALLRDTEAVTVFDQFGTELQIALEKGAYKRLPNNPSRPDGGVHEYCPPEHVASEMDRLIEMHRDHEAKQVWSHLEAAWLHHAFTQIHPFQDGNGRVARTLASLVFIKDDFFPLVVNRDDRARYIEALEVADTGDLSRLANLFAQLQKRALTKAIVKVADVKPAATVEDALAVTRDMLVGLGKIIPADYLKAKETAGALLGLTETRFEQVEAALARDISRVNSTFSFHHGRLPSVPVNALRLVTEEQHYEPNPSIYHESPLLMLTSSGIERYIVVSFDMPKQVQRYREAGSGIECRIVVSFVGVGSAFKGIIAAAAYFQEADKPPVPLSDDIFRITYQEPREEAEARFKPWLEQVLINGLAEWRRTIA